MAALALKLVSKSKLFYGIPNISARHCLNLHQHSNNRLLSTMNNIKSSSSSNAAAAEINPNTNRKPYASRSTEEIYASVYGRDHKYWKVVFLPPDLNPDKPRLTLDLPRDEIIDEYVKILAKVLKSEEEAREKIYSVSTRHFLFFVCQIDLATAVRLLDFVDRFCSIEPVSQKDLTREDHAETAEPFINGKAVKYDPIYHKALLKRFNSIVIGRDPSDRPMKIYQNKSGDLVEGRREGKKHEIQT